MLPTLLSPLPSPSPTRTHPRSSCNAGEDHQAERLAAIGLRTFTECRSEGEAKNRAEGTPVPAPTVAGQNNMVAVGPGLPSIPKKLLDKIRSGDYVDFGELPPAKGKGRQVQQAGEGHIVILQAADLTPTRKAIPDLVTWLQCFGLYVAALAPGQPHRVPELMAYQAIIAKASQTYRWPSWVVYDQSFRQEMAGTKNQSWARVDPSLYSVCFFGQNASADNWCGTCQSLDHSSTACPIKQSRKRAWPGGSGTVGQRTPRSEVCLKYNKFNGDCKFGRECRFRHACSKCGDPHPASRCKAGDKRQRGEDTR